MVFLGTLFIGVNVTFIPLHFVGLQGGNRKFANSRDNIQYLHRISSFGSIVSIIGLFVFLFMLHECIKSYRLVLNKAYENEPISRITIFEHTFSSSALFTSYQACYEADYEWVKYYVPRGHVQ